MNTFVIEVVPKSLAVDPLAAQVKNALVQSGEPPDTAEVHTSKLYRIEGNLTAKQASSVAHTLLVDPVVETVSVSQQGDVKHKLKQGFTTDVWPKKGVTDPVGETVIKGMNDLGIQKSEKATFAQRYIFPRITNQQTVKDFALKHLANELIHDIHIRQNN